MSMTMNSSDRSTFELDTNYENDSFTNETTPQKPLSHDLQILIKVVPWVVPILFSLVILIGFFGNLLVVLVVALNKTMRNTTNILIFNLAVADILFIVLCVPFTTADYAFTSEWPFGDLWCKLVQFFIITTAFVSIYTLVLMSLDRFLAVVFPINSMTLRTEKNTMTAVLVLWVSVMVVCSPLLFAYGLKLNQCQFLRGEQIATLGLHWNIVIFQICFFISGYLLPLLLIICLYSAMLCRLWKQGPSGGKQSAESMKNKKRVVKLIVIVTTIFALSWLPIQLILLLKALGHYPVTVVNITIQITSHVLAYSNSCINPILYAAISPPFRKGFQNLISLKKPGSVGASRYQPEPATQDLEMKINKKKTNGNVNGENIGANNGQNNNVGQNSSERMRNIDTDIGNNEKERRRSNASEICELPVSGERKVEIKLQSIDLKVEMEEVMDMEKKPLLKIN